ncbi:hypothetical protein VTK73DRAFT_1787 [Phialemonium thermophilum]|uniref:NAD-specific glutamate dehydrogenase n=1 Tax=Phialemonium thermophilum TaxID=223376 RepID=A0ABR3X7U2_9PEZI
MVDALAGDAQLLGDAVLLPLELLQLDHADLVAVEVVEILALELDGVGADLELLDHVLELHLPNLFPLVGEPLLLPDPLLLRHPLGLGLLQGLFLEDLALGVLLLSLGLQLGQLFLALLDDLLPRQDLLVLLLGSGLGASEGSLTGLDAGLVERGVDEVAGRVERLGQAGELRAHDVRRRALQALHGTGLALGRAGSGSCVRGLGGGEDVGVEAQDAGGMVHADSKVALLVSVHDELLDHRTSHLEGLRERGQALHKLQVDGLVDLRQLLEEAGQDDLLQGRDVLLHLLVGADLGQDGGDLLADGQRVEVDFENVVEVADLRADPAEERLGEGILEQKSTSRSLRHAQQMSQAGVLVLPSLVEVHHGTTGPRGADDGDGQGGEHDEGGGLLQIGLGRGRVVGFLALSGRHEGGRLTKQVVVSGPGCGVEEVVLPDEEDAGQFLVVVRHHDVLGGTLAEVQQSVDVLDAAEGLLPELELDSDIQLLKAGLQMTL